MTFENIPTIPDPEETKLVDLQGKPPSLGPEFVIQNNDGPIMTVTREGFSGLRFEFGQPVMVLTAFDTYRILEGLRAVLATLPLDMQRPGPD